MFERSPESKETKSKLRVQKQLNRELNKNLDLPKSTEHEWRVVNLLEPGETGWSGAIGDGHIPPGKLIVTSVDVPDSDKEVEVAATEMHYPMFQFPPYRPAYISLGVIVPREGDRRYDSALRLVSSQFVSGELPEFTVKTFFDREQFLQAVASSQTD
ncbi:MAG TPA: hypothetical protein VFH99_00275 [Candidatus Saccharimonadales bacterium]|nr:hypothetical protein [Candidatus Saccharimonadales bacterium]